MVRGCSRLAHAAGVRVFKGWPLPMCFPVPELQRGRCPGIADIGKHVCVNHFPSNSNHNCYLVLTLADNLQTMRRISVNEGCPNSD